MKRRGRGKGGMEKKQEGDLHGVVVWGGDVLW